MWRFVLRRLAFFVFTLIFTSLLVFVLTRVLPGDVAHVILGREASEEQVAALRVELGLDQPLLTQYVDWLGDFVRGDWGRTFVSPRQDIRAIVAERSEKSAWLAGLTLIIAVPLSVGLGVLAGLNEGRWPDGLISLLTLSVVSLPEFVTGLFLINVIALHVDFLPASSSGVGPDTTFLEALPKLWLPAVTATLVLIAYIARLTRAGVIEQLKQDYVRTAELKGLPYRVVVVKHVLRNALLPTVTVVANSTGWLISGLVVIEFVYGYRGLGSLLIAAIENRNLPMIQAIVMVTVSVILVANFLADMLYAVLNPRISLS